MRRPIMRVCVASLVMAAFPAFAEQVSGQVDSWRVVDALAISSDEGIEIAFSDKPFDRAAIAADYRYDILDQHAHESDRGGSLMTLRLDAEGGVSGIGMGGSSLYTSDMDEALKLEKHSAQAIAGRFAYGGYQLSFDLPVWKNGQLPRQGSPLPADGGAAGEALRAYLAALKGNDFDAFVALSPPSWRESMQASKAKGEAQLEIDAVREELPDAIALTGGHAEAQRAWIDLSAKQAGASVKAVATLEQDAGRWYVRRIQVLR